jgi:hypothetical protein
MLLSARAAVVGVAIGVLGTGATFALAHDETNQSDAASVGSANASSPAISVTLGSKEYPTEAIIQEREAAALGLVPPAGESEETDFVAEGAPADWMVKECRSATPLTTVLHCDAIIAIAEGRLAPGAYSDSQLRAKLGG